tara:strand:+ start:914 stop:1360 length:447 start_codon:yes stop_codon:yes gene_type:complete
MYRLAVTHFNNNTLNENINWKQISKYNGAIYNSPVKIKTDIPLHTPIYVIEMNNDTNKLIGVGLINNYNHTNKKYKIYKDLNYNRYTYKGKFRLDSNFIDVETLIDLENRLFKGKNHLKRSQGIVEVPKLVSYEYLDYIHKLFMLFVN